MKFLFIGDIVGRIGRQTIAKLVPRLKKELNPDLVIANAENSAHGSGVTETIVKELLASGIDYMTTGDHAFRVNKQLAIFNNYPILRPANFPPGLPGAGWTTIPVGKKKIVLINLIGRVLMKADYDCPFRKLDEILANLNLPDKNISAILVDMHAETTSEKICFGLYADGRVSAILGTHTHIMTADQKITKLGTGYITDVGMAGYADGSLGVDAEDIIKTFLTQIKYPHIIPKRGNAILSAVLLTINTKTIKTTAIKPIIKYIKIK
ncbi:MAG: TIGR00282 family metallophosphoesterase [Patescibacteria group bacterium]|nr:TIGR00282 family metallophosphoesterase [Patescibacteria group bacterium]